MSSDGEVQMLAAALKDHVDDCKEHREKTADRADRQRGEMKAEILDRLESKHAINVLTLHRQDSAIADIQSGVDELKATVQRIMYGALGLTGAGFLTLILDKLGWVPLGK